MKIEIATKVFLKFRPALPEQAFLMVGSIEGAIENGKRMAEAA